MVFIYVTGSSDLTIHLEETLCNYSKIALIECSLHHSWYNITEDNNIFRFKDRNGHLYVQAIPPGRYNLQELQSRMYEGIHYLLRIRISRTEDINRLYFNLGRREEVDFSHEKNFSKLLGFKEKKYKHSGTRSTKQYYSKHVSIILPIREYLIQCDIIESKDNLIDGHRCDILDVLPAKETYNTRESTTYCRKTVIYKNINKRDITSMRLWITDDDAKIIDFRGYKIHYKLEII